LWVSFLVAAQAGEVLLVDGRAGGGAGTTTATTGSSRGSTTTGSSRGGTTTGSTAGSTVTTTSGTVTTGGTVTTTATTAATGTGGSRAGLLDEAHVNVKEVLLLALLLTLGLLGGRLNVGLGLLVLQLLGGSPLLVLLGALVGGTHGLGSEAVLSSLLSQVVAVGLGLVGLLSLLSGGLGFGLVGLGDGLTNALVVPGLLTGLAAPALLDLLAGVTVKTDDGLVSIACRVRLCRVQGFRAFARAFSTRFFASFCHHRKWGIAYVWPVRDWRSPRPRLPPRGREGCSASSVGFWRLLVRPALRSRKAIPKCQLQLQLQLHDFHHPISN
jgi:hypothetical protein